MFRDIWNMWMNTTTEMGRYDMYNRMGMWLEGFYLDSGGILFIWEMRGVPVLTRAEEVRQKRIRKVRLKNEDSVGKEKLCPHVK